MLAPGGVLWLLRHELRLGWRRWSTATRKRGLGTIVFYVLAAAFLLFGGYWAARLLAYVPAILDPTALTVIGLVLALLFSFMLSQALMLIVEAIYQRGDLDLLLASPVPPWRLLLVRMAAISINVALFYLVLLCAVFIYLPFFGAWRWMALMPSVLALALLATSAALLLARAMFQLFGPKRTRVIAQIAAGLIGAGFFLALQAQNFMPGEQRAQVWTDLMAHATPILGDVSSLLSLPARAALGQPAAFAVWTTVALGGYVAAVWWFASRFTANAAAIAGLGARKRRADVRARRMRGGLGMSLVRKEWRLLARDPLLLSQIMLQLLYLLPLFFVFGARLGEDGIERFGVAAFAATFVLLATSLAASLAWLTVSAEDAPDLIAAAPVPHDEVANAKAFAAGAPVLLLMLAPSLGAAWLSPAAGAWMFVGCVASIASVCLIQVWYRTPGSRKDFRRRRRGSFMVGFAQFFITTGWTAATALAVSGWALASIIPALIALGVLLAMHESRPKAAAPGNDVA